MEDIMKADIFFFIASIGFIVMSLLFAVILFYILKLVRTVQRITDRIEAQSEEISNDVNNFRSFMYKGGIFAAIVGLLNNRK